MCNKSNCKIQRKEILLYIGHAPMTTDKSIKYIVFGNILL